MLPKAKKTFGQNFLVDQTAVKKIIDAAEIQKGETVLEIGPGTGILTNALICAGAKVIAVELDHDLVLDLQKKFGDKIKLIEGDVLCLFDASPKKDEKSINFIRSLKYKLVANIPYNITSSILERFLSKEPRPSRMILMVQKEVADRILAIPPKMSLLSVVCQMYANCSRISIVKSGAFRPIPKVDSAIVRFDIKTSVDPSYAEHVIALAKQGFSSKRKQLQNNLSGYSKKTSEDIKNILNSIGLNQKIRSENLTLEDWERLFRKIR